MPHPLPDHQPHRPFRRAVLSTVLGTIALLALVVAPPRADALTSYCGTACNGKSPTGYLFNGATCSSDSIRVNGPVYPQAANGAVDRYMQVYLRYSPRCQTIWVESNNLAATGRTACYTHIESKDGPNIGLAAICDGAGGGTTYGLMGNDHDPNNGVYGDGVLQESYPGNVGYTAFTPGY